MRKTNKEVTGNPVMGRIMDLMQQKGIKQNELSERLGLSGNVFSQWKYRGTTSFTKYLGEIAKYLGVTESYLLNGFDEETNYRELDPNEVKIIEQIRLLSASERDVIENLLDVLCTNKTKTNTNFCSL